ncbi:MAG: ABC transporter substrate-binding protein [Chloroflexi bacterium]|nr:ABC transporter substrate-binding protein [Chloroflexota bacterium]
MRTKRVLAFLGVLVLLLAACGPAATATPQRVVQTPTPTPGEPIRIGHLLALTGPFAGIMEIFNPGVDCAFEEVGWQVAGRPIKLVREDTQFKADVALSKAKKLMEVDKIHLGFGPQVTFEAQAAKEYLTQSGIPWITSDLALPDWAQKGTNIFHVGPIPQQAFTDDVLSYIYNDLGIRKAIVYSQDHPGGRLWSQGFMDGFKKVGGQIVQENYFPPDIVDHAVNFPKLKVGEADAIVTALWGAAAARFVKQADEYGLTKKTKVLGLASMVEDDTTLPAVGKSAVGIVSLYALPPPDYDNPAYKRLNDCVAGKIKLPPGMAIQGYLEARAAIEAIKAVKGNVEDRGALLQALRNVSFDSPQGAFSFQECQLGRRTIFVKKVVEKAGVVQNEMLKTFASAPFCP